MFVKSKVPTRLTTCLSAYALLLAGEAFLFAPPALADSGKPRVYDAWQSALDSRLTAKYWLLLQWQFIDQKSGVSALVEIGDGGSICGPATMSAKDSYGEWSEVYHLPAGQCISGSYSHFEIGAKP